MIDARQSWVLKEENRFASERYSVSGHGGLLGDGCVLSFRFGNV